MVRGAEEPQVRREKNTMAIGNNKGVTIDRGGVGVHHSQGRGGQENNTKSVYISLDLTGNTAVVRSDYIITKVGESKN